MAKNKKGNKTLKGGRLIGSGSSGYVFRPPLKCGDKTYSADYVSKVFFDERSAKEEYEKGLLVRELDPDSKHFITPEDICEYDKSQENANYPKFTKTKNMLNRRTRSKHKRGLQVIYKYGGVPIYDIFMKSKRKDEIDFDDKKLFDDLDTDQLNLFIKCMKKAVSLLDLLHEQCVHGDLTHENMVYDEEHGIRLIDFGKAELISDLTPSQVEKRKAEDFASLCAVCLTVIDSAWLQESEVFDDWISKAKRPKLSTDDYRTIIKSIPDAADS